MTATQSINGQPVDSANFYQFNPYIDELTYDEAMYTNLVNAGFPSTIGMLIDTSRNGWGGPNRPTGPSTSTDLNTFVNQSKVDQRPFRGDWCNQNNAGLGPFPQANPNSSFTHLYAYVWIKPPGESDGDYPTATHIARRPALRPERHQHRREREHLPDQRHTRLRHPGRAVVPRPVPAARAERLPRGPLTGQR